MKNDFEYIKNKIENSSVKAPEDMDESFVLSTIENVQPRPVVLGQQPKRRHTAAVVSTIAAALVVMVALGVVLSTHFGQNNNLQTSETIEMPGGMVLRQFQSHDEVKQAVEELRNERTSGNNYLDRLFGGEKSDGNVVVEEDRSQAGYAQDAEAPADGANSSSGSSNASGGNNTSHSETYVQVEGVDEGDIIKTDGEYIYAVDNSYGSKGIIIYTADGDKSHVAAEIDVYNDTPQTAATNDESPVRYYYNTTNIRNIQDIYVKGDRLIVIYDDSSATKDMGSSGMTCVKVYDISDINHITLLDTMHQSGHCDASRMIDDTLYTVSTYSINGDNYIPSCGRGDSTDLLDASCIYAPEDPQSESFLLISAYNTLDFSVGTESKAIFGGVDDVYCNEDHLYIYTTHREFDESRWEEESYDGDFTTEIIKVDLTNGIELAAYSQVEGEVDDQYALDEYEDHLRIATTSNKNGIDTNNLFVLDEDLNQVGSVTGFAKNESIKAVRYIGDTAYVITYEQTDPLFVIDLSEPADPAILGEVKITGFSSMLVPIDENTLLGIGYHTENEDYTSMEVEEGLKLALFDISDKTNPKVLDSKSYVNYYSPVQLNPKALVYNSERGDFVIPMNYVYYGAVDYESYEGDEYMPNEERTGGMLNFKAENGKLKEIDLYQKDYIETERCVYVGDYVYMTYYDGSTLKLDHVAYQ